MKWAVLAALIVALVVLICMAYHLGNKGGLADTYAVRDAAGNTVASYTFQPDGSFVYTVSAGTPQHGWYTVTDNSLDIHYFPTLTHPIPRQGGTYDLRPDRRSFWAGLAYVKQ